MPGKFTITGLDAVKEKLARLIDNVRPAGEQALKEVSEETRDYLVNAIKTQKIKVKPLNSDYARWKRKVGLDPRIFIASGEYVQSIENGRTMKGWTVAPDPKYQKLASWLEYGTRTMPARPHWRIASAFALTRWALVPGRFGELLFRGV